MSPPGTTRAPAHPSLSAPGAAELAEWLADARARTLALVADLTDGQLRVPRERILNPPLWEIGHVAWFQEKWNLRQGVGRAPLRADADSLFDSAAVAHDSRWDLLLPARVEVLDYLEQVLRRTTELLLTGSPTAEARYFAQLALFHEDMHGEALAYTRQTLALPEPPGLALEAAPAPAGPWPGDVEVPGGTLQLGAAPGETFVFDNEKWSHPVGIAPFRMARAPVTQAEFAEFVEAGGYSRDDVWCEEGRRWRNEALARHPVYWRREPSGRWLRRHFDRFVALEEDRPVVHVNWFEAAAWCAWAGRRLPTEAEWEWAASFAGDDARAATRPRKRTFPWGDAAPSRGHGHLGMRSLHCADVAAFPDGDGALGLRQLLGNVWEWTASDFAAFPGFSPDPYKEYSEPWFGWHKVLRGGCLATQPRLLRNTWRNFYTPDRRDVWAGFRTCRVD